MEEEKPKSLYKIKTRNEMKTVNVVFVSDELVGETIVNRKEYDRAQRQRVKTETPKPEEAETITPGKVRKRKASEGPEEEVNPKKPKIDEVELALAALVQEDEGSEDAGKEDAKKGGEGKDTPRKEDASKKDTNKKDKNKKDAGKDDTNKKDKGKKDESKDDTSKKDKGQKDTSKEDTSKKDKSKRDTGKDDTSKKEKSKRDTGKEETNKKDKSKKDTDKDDASKKDKSKRDTDKGDMSKKEKSKRDTDKEDTSKKDKRKEDRDKHETEKKSSENSEKENVEAEGEGNVPMEQLRRLMGDERDISFGADSTNRIMRLESCGAGEGPSQNGERGIHNTTPRSQGNETRSKVTTPYSLRKRVIKDIKKIQRILENSDTEDDDITTSESEFLESSEESDAEEKSRVTENGEASDSGETPVNRRRVRDDPAPSTSSGINYFEAQSVKRNITSNNTLKNLKNPILTQKELNKIVRKFKLSPGHRSAIKSLINETTMCFSKWDFLLKNNFNILLYGVGCKREIVNNFVDRFARKYPLIVVNGFFPDLSVREITEKICEILEIGAAKFDITAEINRKLNEYHVEIYIVVNNIDGLMLRNKKTQTILSQYAKMEGIHILATIDHINAPLMWDKSTFSDFNWIWYDATTFLNYTDEVVYEGNIMLQGNGKLTLSSLRNVYYSLTKNSRSIFLLMARRELNTPSGVRRGLSFKELYQACRKELLISSDVALRALLKEFIDHAIVKAKKNQDGDEVFVITLETNILKQFLDDQEHR